MARCVVCDARYEGEHVCPHVRLSAVDASIAKQLQNSMELNARMKSRLQRLSQRLRIDDDVNALSIVALDSIMKDEEPTWTANEPGK